MKNKDAKDLLARYQSGQCNELEIALLESWYIKRASLGKADISDDELEEIVDEIWNKLPVHQEERAHIRRIRIGRIAAAASVVLFLAIGAYFGLHNISDNKQIAKNRTNDVAPGGNKAILTLADGRKITLTDAANGKLAEQGNVLVNKTADGDLTYKNTNSNVPVTVYNTLSTPVGGQYHLTLADGTSVWLNALSSIKYPTDFTGDDRKVEITGEAYFEVAHNAAKPFMVVSNDQIVEVLGTHFNINSYADERDTKTTLLEGSVKVIGAHGPLTIKPGQQSVLRDGNLSANNANMEEAIAWKNGEFVFNDKSISDIMKQIARWYGVSIVFNDSVSEGYLTGSISRNRKLSQVLKMMEKTKEVKFRIDGGTIYVSKYN